LTWSRQKGWLSQSEYRKQKRAKEKARSEAKRREAARQLEPEQIKKQAEVREANEARLRKANSVSTKLWAWGVNSEKHPTYALGVFPTIIMYLVVVPVLGLLYKASFTLLGPLMVIGAALIALVHRGIRR
jgi:Flp pilus assembly protein TadB